MSSCLQYWDFCPNHNFHAKKCIGQWMVIILCWNVYKDPEILTSVQSSVLLHMRQLFEPSVAVRTFVRFFSSVHPYVLDQLVIRWKSLQALLTLVGLHVPTGSAWAAAAASRPAHATPASCPAHAPMASRGCGRSRTTKVHSRSFCHQVLKKKPCLLLTTVVVYTHKRVAQL